MADIAPTALDERALIDIVDDDGGLCQALVRLVRSVGYEGRAHGSVAAFLAEDRAERPGCIVLDVRLPDMSGLDFQASLDRRGIAQPVIMMTGYGDIPMSVRAMKAGAVDFLTKPFRDQDLLDAISSAVARDRERLTATAERAAIEERYRNLTEREQQVLAGIVGGLMNKDIARQLDLSVVTVKAHRGSLHRKMGVTGVADLVRCAKILGLADG